MRTHEAWRRRFTKLLAAEYSPTGDQPSASALMDVELSLYLLQSVAEGQSARGMPALLDGYRAVWEAVADVRDDTAARLANARTLLWRRHRPFGWDTVLRDYLSVPEHVRGYDLDPAGIPQQRRCRVAPARWAMYEQMLTAPLPFDPASQQEAAPGDYRMGTTAHGSGITVPEDLPAFPAPALHDLTVRARHPVKVIWEELLRTAREMDDADRGHGRRNSWEQRLREVRLQLRAVDGTFVDADTLTLDGMLHMVGLVSVGKTTLVMVLAVWAAQQGHTVTIVLGDNSSALRATDDLSRYRGVTAAPAMGTNRTRHTERLHRLQPPRPGHLTPDQPFGFDFVSTACALDPLRSNTSPPLEVREAPCQDLVEHSPEDTASRWRDKPKRRCPLWHGCQRHEASRRLVRANIWVATPWSLVHTRVPIPLTDSRLRYFEAAWRRSDILLVDEADQVQANLDEMFASAQVLLGPSEEAWIDEIGARVTEKLRMSSRAQNASQEVRRFELAVRHAQTAATVIYQLLQRDRARPGRPVLSTLDRDYFTAWSLFDRLAQEWAGHAAGPHARPVEGWEDDPVYVCLRDAFNAFIDDPTGAQDVDLADELVALVTDLLTDTDEQPREDRLRAWLHRLLIRELAPGRRIVVTEVDTTVRRLELALAVAVMAHRLNQMLAQWPNAAAELDMQDALTAELRRPPSDLVSVVPDSPMGNVLGFQYVEDDDTGTDGKLGEFRFFRYSGVGRMLLVGLPDLFPADGSGPHTVLLSGTSWAGTSPRYHVDVPVGAILRPSAEKLDEIGRTTFRLDIQTTGERSTSIWVSGRYGSERHEALREMVRTLTRPGPGPGQRCRLERERDDLAPGRQKVLLLVGSYVEARLVAEALRRFKPSWSDQVRCLVGDDELETGWDSAHLLRRSDVAEFGTDDAWLLVAPVLAVERGHNILNDAGVAAIGAAFFLVRPHPRPRDLGYVTQRINQYALHQLRSQFIGQADEHERLAAAGTNRRRAAQRRWRRLLHTRVAYSQLDDDERNRVAWTQLVTIWQVVGRLLRGGQAAKVYFCDAAFAPHTALRQPDLLDDAGTSLLHGMREVLDPYFDHMSTDPDRHLVQALYRPLHNALTAMGGR